MERTRYPACYGKHTEGEAECKVCVIEEECAGQVEKEPAGGKKMTNWHVVLNAIADYVNLRLDEFKILSQSMNLDPKKGIAGIEISFIPANELTWDQMLDRLGARKKNYEFAVLCLGGRWEMSEPIRAYDSHEAEEILKKKLTEDTVIVAGTLLMREWEDEEE